MTVTQKKTPSKSSGGGGDDNKERILKGGGGTTAMRVIVPLQGVVQGRGDLVLGSLIPCALFYFFQLYFKRKRPDSSSSSSSSSPPTSPSPPPSSSSPNNLQQLPRTHSRTLLSPRNPSAPPPLSSRASSSSFIRAADDFASTLGYKKWAQDPYNASDNPHGVFQLALAENRLSLDLIREWLAENVRDSLLDEEKVDLGVGGLVTYQPYDGLMKLKIAVAGFMEQVTQSSVPFNPSQIVLTAGATPAIEILSFCLADQGNAILVPSPYYPGFNRNLKWRNGIELIPVPCRSTDKFNISVSALERAYNQAKKRGLKVRALLISNPSNPVGNLLTREMLYDLLDFTTEKNIHLISDEVFAGCLHGLNNFVSVAEVLSTEDDFDRSRVHIIYSLSKDFSLPGFRVGVIYSFNENVLAAATKLARFSSVSVLTQRLLISMLSDKKFVSEFVEINRMRLRKMYNLFVDCLKKLGIDCCDSSGGFFCWVDMGKFLRSYSEKGEIELWDKLLNVAKINVMPGSSCRCIEHGWFRFCFATLGEGDVPVVMERIKRAIEGHKVQ